jgi:hypothetical protein
MQCNADPTPQPFHRPQGGFFTPEAKMAAHDSDLINRDPLERDGVVMMPRGEFKQFLEHAAEMGAKRALANVGLDGETAAEDIRELRSLLDAFTEAKRTAWKTVIHMITTGFLLSLVAGAAIKLKVFGG